VEGELTLVEELPSNRNGKTTAFKLFIGLLGKGPNSANPLFLKILGPFHYVLFWLIREELLEME